jgi:hypothetical protein
MLECWSGGLMAHAEGYQRISGQGIPSTELRISDRRSEYQVRPHLRYNCRTRSALRP